MDKRRGRGDPVINMQRPRRTLRLVLLVVLGVVLAGASTTASYYVDALWFDSLGLASVFWTRLSLEAATFTAFALATFLLVYGVFRVLKPDRLDDVIASTFLINRRPLRLPIDRFLKLIGLGSSLALAAIIGSSMAARWMTLALYWRAPRSADMLDPIFDRSLDFYLFTLPALQLIFGWLLTLSIIASLIAAAFVAVMGGAGVAARWRSSAVQTGLWRGFSLTVAALLVMLAVRAYLGRFELLFQEGTIFSGVTYTDAHVTLGGTLVVCAALIVGAAIAAAAAAPRPRWLLAVPLPAIACYLIVGGVRWYVSGFIVAPNQLVRERPFIAHNIDMTRRAYALERIETHPFPADTGIEAVEPGSNQTTLENIRLWDARALQDTLRQIQEISGYRHRSIRGRRYRAPDDVGDTRAQCGEVAAEQPQLDQREARLYPWLRGHHESGEWLHRRRAADAGPQQYARAEHDSPPRGDPPGDLFRRAHQHRCLCQDSPEGVQLPARRLQQSDFLSG
jgi:uncharacterized membrane protein (UPF0182 family)